MAPASDPISSAPPTSKIGRPLTPPASPATEGPRNTDHHLRWLRSAEHWGPWLRCSDSEIAEPELIWMMRHASGRVRFYATGKGQVGPEHRNVVEAAYAMWSDGWLWADDDGTVDLGLQLQCRAWVRSGGAERQEAS